MGLLPDVPPDEAEGRAVPTLRASRREHVARGLASFAAACCFLTVASELWDDLWNGAEHFPLPEAAKVWALVLCMVMAVLEAGKVRRRAEAVAGG
jgi:hypothetical protein